MRDSGRRASRHAAALVAALGVAGCVLEAPHYDGTRFACAATSPQCPEAHACVDGWCVPAGEPAGPDGELDASRADAGADAGPRPSPPDAADAGAGPVDAGLPPDAAAGPPMTISLSGPSVTFDTHIEADDPDLNFTDDDDLEIDADPEIVALLRFDTRTIPPGAVVLAAELIVEVLNPIEDGTYELRPLLEAWDDAEATWIRRTADEAWASPGAGAGAHALAPVVSFAPRDHGSTTVALPIELVQGWVADPDQNHGVRWHSVSATGRGGEVASSQHADETLAPVLRVVYR